MATPCEDCERLESAVREAFERIILISTSLLEALRNSDQATFSRLDKELELTAGAKERAIGAFRQHSTEPGH
jgi:hypothetical protein